MKKIFKNMSLAVVALLMAIGLTGCGGSEDIQTSNPVNIAFVVGIADDETNRYAINLILPSFLILIRR